MTTASGTETSIRAAKAAQQSGPEPGIDHNLMLLSIVTRYFLFIPTLLFRYVKANLVSDWGVWLRGSGV